MDSTFTSASLSKGCDAISGVTGDADQRPAIERVQTLFGKPVHVCFPPRRKSYDLEKATTSCFWAPEEAYRKSQFPVVVDIPGGFTVTKPSTWNRK
jgi:hypothetical protein